MDKTIVEREGVRGVTTKFVFEEETDSIAVYNCGFGDMEEKLGDVSLTNIELICRHGGKVALADMTL